MIEDKRCSSCTCFSCDFEGDCHCPQKAEIKVYYMIANCGNYCFDGSSGTYKAELDKTKKI